MLSALRLARAIEAGEFTPAQAVELCADAIAERESDVGAFVTLDLEGARKAAVAARPQGQAAARPAGRAQGHFRHRRHADRIRLADLRRLPAEGGRFAGRADPPRRRHADRQDRHHRVRPSRSGQDPQPAQPRAHAGRLVVGLGGGRRRGLLPDRHRQPDRRLGDPARELLRRRRLQAVVPAAADRRHEMRVLASRHRGPVRRVRRRRGLRRGRHQRPRSARRRPDARVAAHRRAARAALAARPATT